MNQKTQWQIGWGYTSVCDMRCPFCYSRTVRKQPEEIPLELAQSFVRNNADAIASINYGTGECALSENWSRLIGYVRSKFPKIRQALTTNGSVYRQIRSGKLDAELLFSSIDEIDVSLDFADEVKHVAMRGKEDAFEGAMGTLALCSVHHVIPTIVTVAFADTLSEENLDGLFALAKTHGAFVRLNILRPVAGVSFAPPDFETLFRALRYVTAQYYIVSMCDPLFGAVFGVPVQQGDSVGISSLRILPNGMITPSTYLITPDWQAERLAEDFHLERLRGLAPFQTIRSAQLPAECRRCTLAGHYRGGAIDRRILYYQSLAERDPYCPFRHDHSAEALDCSMKHYKNALRPFVHDGYLPTLIFSPTEGAEA